MRANIETLINGGWTQVATLSAAVSDANIVKLKWLLDNLPVAEDLLLQYRSQGVAVNAITKSIAAEQAKPQPDADTIAQMQAELRRAQQYMKQADGRIEIILFEYGKL